MVICIAVVQKMVLLGYGSIMLGKLTACGKILWKMGMGPVSDKFFNSNNPINFDH